MAHECPECGMTCYCNGDIDDCDYGEYMEGCEHWKRLSCEGHEEWCNEPECICRNDHDLAWD